METVFVILDIPSKTNFVLKLVLIIAMIMALVNVFVFKITTKHQAEIALLANLVPLIVQEMLQDSVFATLDILILEEFAPGAQKGRYGQKMTEDASCLVE